MSEQEQEQQEPDRNEEFLRAAQDEEQGIVGEFLMFMAENRMWWLAPILVVFGLLAVLLVIGTVAPGAVPFIYSFW